MAGKSLEETLLGQAPAVPRGEIKNSRGLKLSYREWTLSIAQPKATIFILHAAAEHSGRYQRLAQDLNSKGYEVFAMDHQGFGESEGVRCHVLAFNDYVNDVEQFINHITTVRPASANLPRFLVGHSMGALVAVHAALRPRFADLRIRGVALLSPGILPPGAAPAKSFVRSVQSAVYPRSVMSYPNKTLDTPLTHDPASDEAYRNDPLVYLGGLRARFTSEVLDAMHAASRDAAKFEVPLLVMHGTENGLNKYSDSQKWFNAAGSQDKTFFSVPGAYHELHNEAEPFRSMVRDELCSWIERRLAGPVAASRGVSGDVVYAPSQPPQSQQLVSGPPRPPSAPVRPSAPPMPGQMYSQQQMYPAPYPGGMPMQQPGPYPGAPMGMA
mmetsp:Transcript_27593/g.53871  ORF Transcript_27593/g.53871 Transcript_27593/m.53871 type:complete len:384 (-) Transcript_27593:232-1383(-)